MEKISFTEILSSEQSRPDKARLITEKIREARNYPWVGLYDVNKDEISLVSYSGKSEPVFTSFPRDKGLNGRAVMKKATVIVNDTEQDEDYLLTFTRTKSEIIVPVFEGDNGTIVGTIDTEGETKDAFSKEDAEFLEECARSISSFWNNK